MWAVPKKLADIHKFPKHIMHFISIFDKDGGLFKKCLNIPMHNEVRRGLDS